MNVSKVIGFFIVFLVASCGNPEEGAPAGQEGSAKEATVSSINDYPFLFNDSESVVNINDFSEFNDFYGINSGDAIIVEVAERITE